MSESVAAAAPAKRRESYTPAAIVYVLGQPTAEFMARLARLTASGHTDWLVWCIR